MQVESNARLRRDGRHPEADPAGGNVRRFKVAQATELNLFPGLSELDHGSSPSCASNLPLRLATVFSSNIAKHRL